MSQKNIVAYNNIILHNNNIRTFLPTQSHNRIAVKPNNRQIPR